MRCAEPMRSCSFAVIATPLPFDVSTIRVNDYDPDHAPDEARVKVRSALEDALRELDLTRTLAVRRALEALDEVSINTLIHAGHNGFVEHPEMLTVRDSLGKAAVSQAIGRLLEIGLLRLHLAKISPEEVLSDRPPRTRYAITTMGKAVVAELAQRWGVVDTDGRPDHRCPRDGCRRIVEG